MLHKRYFTTQARTAACASRKKTMLERDAKKGGLEVFLVRRGNSLTWEIRKFGGVVIETGTEGFSSEVAAQAAGNAVLRGLLQTD